MPRIDDYIASRALAAQHLREQDPQVVAARGRAEYQICQDQEGLILSYFGRQHWINWPEVAVTYLEGEGEVPIQEQILMLHYLENTKGDPLTGETIDFRQAPGGQFYYSAFVGRAQTPLLKIFGQNLELYRQVAEHMGGELAPLGDVAATYLALPLVPITHVLWKGDEEFEPAVTILFDLSIVTHLPTEDIAAISGMSVYRLMGMARKLMAS
ncbi:DUF3786 domain-containing protein [Desulfobacca acetoxidans]|uniref:DUF3786 domain-containing protein n=1 Tax=Desulfobacca acetoxidans (strain ATCC 700848 / DSM 11109 / ASRB2) TaxID=880072 RepID=F2NID0_DESAR|nr:DUF3786 domain-containing protein [Desulfobacca acetoxidans]AEB10332.1 hypothetical protein Desac_2514 [Desulfobacca acetoxidans DSM 11109]